MDLVTLAICKKLISKGISIIGTIFTLKGTVSSYEDLPLINNKNGDMYLVGPKKDGSYDEFYWSSNERWEAMGNTGINYGGYVTTEDLYTGENDLGTPENPAEGTILAKLNDNLKKYIDDTFANCASKEDLEYLKAEINKNNELEII